VCRHPECLSVCLFSGPELRKEEDKSIKKMKKREMVLSKRWFYHAWDKMRNNRFVEYEYHCIKKTFEKYLFTGSKLILIILKIALCFECLCFKSLSKKNNRRYMKSNLRTFPLKEYTEM
jgi:hypothetical protein